jgi:hypothetical protein
MQTTIVDQFTQIIARIRLEYDLDPDVLATAEDILETFRAREPTQLQTGQEDNAPISKVSDESNGCLLR